FHPENYQDEVSVRVRDLIQQKVDSGKEITASATAQPQQAQVIDLMEALRASLSGNAGKSKPASASKPSRASSRAVQEEPVNIESKRKGAKPAPRKAAAAAPAVGKKTKARERSLLETASH